MHQGVITYKFFLIMQGINENIVSFLFYLKKTLYKSIKMVRYHLVIDLAKIKSTAN